MRKIINFIKSALITIALFPAYIFVVCLDKLFNFLIHFMTRKSKNRRRKIFRKELKVTWSRGGHRSLKEDLINKKEFNKNYE